MLTRPLHHAYFIEGEREPALKDLFAYLKKDLGVIITGNPDFIYESFATFTIDDGRWVKEMQANKAFGGGKKIFVIETYTMTMEAQNSLLKVFEEPTRDTHFFIVAPSSSFLLPTLRSRVFHIKHGVEEGSDACARAKGFLEGTPKERIESVKDLISEKDREEARRFVAELVLAVRAKDPKHRSMRDLALALDHIGDKSSSVKLVLEHLALVV